MCICDNLTCSIFIYLAFCFIPQIYKNDYTVIIFWGKKKTFIAVFHPKWRFLTFLLSPCGIGRRA
nr:MAG TPA: hypothetical protein [Caudoviricetes sp.]